MTTVPPEEPPPEDQLGISGIVSPAKHYLMTALSCSNDAQEEVGPSEDDRHLVEEIDQVKMVISSVLEQIPRLGRQARRLRYRRDLA